MTDNYEDFYEALDLHSLSDELDEYQEIKRRSGINWVDLRPGRNVLRILPPRKGVRTPFEKSFLHYLRTEDETYVVPCLAKNEDKPCPICAKIKELRRNGQKEEAKEMRAGLAIYANAMIMDDPQKKGVFVLRVPQGVYQSLLKHMDPRDPESVGDITHPLKGFNIIIDREGTGRETKYQVRVSRNSTPLVAEQLKYLPEMNVLSQINEERTTDEVKALLEQYSGEPTRQLEGATAAPSPAAAEYQPPPADGRFADLDDDGEESPF